MESTQRTIQLLLKPGQHDGDGQRVAEAAQRHLGLTTGRVQSTALYTVRYPVTDAQLRDFATHCLQDPVLHDVAFDEFRHAPGYKSYILVAKLPGVTDDEGISAQNALGDFLNEPLDTHTQHIFSKRLYFLEEALPEADLRHLAQELLGNKHDQPLRNRPHHRYPRLHAAARWRGRIRLRTRCSWWASPMRRC